MSAVCKLPSFFDTPPSQLLEDPTLVCRPEHRSRDCHSQHWATRYCHKAWCSWCRSDTFHGRVAHWRKYALLKSTALTIAICVSLYALVSPKMELWPLVVATSWVSSYVAVRMGRDVHQCQVCAHRTLRCRNCSDAMTRGYASWLGIGNPQHCLTCAGVIQTWRSTSDCELQRLVRSSSFCSWCQRICEHRLFAVGTALGRDSYECMHCRRYTVPCWTCSSAMARLSNWPFGSLACSNCAWSPFGRFSSPLSADPNRKIVFEYAPPRRKTLVHPLIDGEEFLEAVADLIEGAHSSVYMSFWHMSDKIYLRRRVDTCGRPVLSHADRFDVLVRRKAQQGVRFYILLWKEKSRRFWLDNFSAEMKVIFEALHENVHVIRHGHPAFGMTLWSHHQKFVVADQSVAIVGGFDVCLGRYDTPRHDLWDFRGTVSEKQKQEEGEIEEKEEEVKEQQQCGASIDTPMPFQMWPGIDYYNPHLRRPESITPFFRDTVDRQRVQRMPWHDVDVHVAGMLAHDVSRTFIQRWNHHSHGRADILVPLPIDNDNDNDNDKDFSCAAQIVRSMGPWSGATEAVDCSLYEACMRMIEMAEHFIYIENQYYATSMAGNCVRNQIGHALLRKLRDKIGAGHQFRIIFMVPMPEEIGEGALTILNWLYRSVNRGGSSLLEQLGHEFPGVDLGKYICFCCARRCALGNRNTPAVTEKVYLHSKLMIVDDNVAMVSSANLNDRSLLGDRDSELGVVFEDECKVESMLSSRPVMVSKCVREFRLRLWREHLGRLDGCGDSQDLWDVCDPDVYGRIWVDTARRNTEIYERVFPSIPRNIHTTLEAFIACGGPTVPAPCRGNAHELTDVHGALVLHPIEFLRNEHIETWLEKCIGHRSSQ